MPLLESHSTTLHFGGLKALANLTFKMEEKESLGIIGPNGAGKTTLFNLLTGVYRPSSGHLNFEGGDLAKLSSAQINRRGIARTFQNIRLFENLTVLDNVLAALHQSLGYRWSDLLWHRRRYRVREKSVQEEAEQWLEKFHLLEQKNQIAKQLSYGNQRRLEIVRALATKPKLLLLDEPAAGMNPTERRDFIEFIHGIQREYGLSLLVIEHDLAMVTQLCPRLLVLNYGNLIADGSPESVKKNPQVIEAYLGKQDAAN